MALGAILVYLTDPIMLCACFFYQTSYRQPTLRLIDLCLEVLTVLGIEFLLFWAKAFPLL